MKFIIGVDVAKFSLFFSILDEKSSIYMQKQIESKEKKDMERSWEMMNEVEDFLLDFIDTHNITANDITLAIEEPIYLNNIKVSFALDRSMIACQMACLNVGVPCFSYANTVWKKAILGRGNASKEDVAKWVETRWKKYPFGIQDFKDAACLALYMYQLLYPAKEQNLKREKNKRKND